VLEGTVDALETLGIIFKRIEKNTVHKRDRIASAIARRREGEGA
jgi:hypothetical protein